jgi:hypothetical protein
MTAELRLIAAPGPTYAALARDANRAGPLIALRRPLVAALILGSSMTMAGTRRAEPVVLFSTILCWSSVIALQMLIAVIVIARPASRTVGVARALDLFFASHAPWSLWMLAAVAWAPFPGERSALVPLLAALVPLLLTARMIAAFFREVLELDPRVALVRTAVHQAITWGTFVILYGSAVAIVPRIVQWIG